MRSLPQQEYHDAIHMLPLRWMKCIKAEGEYFEGVHVEVDPGDFGLEIVIDNEEDSEDEEETVSDT